MAAGEHRAQDLPLAAAFEPGEPDDLAAADGEAHAAQAALAQVTQADQRLALGLRRRRARGSSARLPAAQELHEVGVADPAGRPRPGDPAVAHDRDAVGHVEGFAEAVGDEDERDAFAAPSPHVGAKLLGLP